MLMRSLPLVLAVLLLTGCFGDGGDSRGGASADFAKQVNGVCRESNNRFKALGKPPERDTPSYAQYVRHTRTIAREVGAKMRRLRVPRNVDPVLRQWRRQIDVLSRQSASVGRATAQLEADIRADRLSGPESDAHLDALSKAEGDLIATTERLDRLSRRAGLTECVRQD